MTLIRAAYLLLPVVAMGASSVTVSTPAKLGDTAIYSVPLTFISRVTPDTPGGPTPTGTLTFILDGLTGATQTLDSAGAGTTAITPAVGTHTIKAQYSSDSNYTTNISSPFTFTVEKAESAVSLSSTAAQLNQQVTLRAVPALVSPAAGAVSGTVDFSIGGAPIAACTSVVVQSGVAICNTTISQIGTVTVTAAYSGDATCKPSSGTLQVQVGKVVAGTYAAVSPEAPLYGTPVTLSALLLGATGVPMPTGTISFVVGNSTLAPMTVGTDGRASLIIPTGSLGPLPAGVNQVAVQYSGDERYQSSRSTTQNVTVAKAPATMALAATPIAAGQTTTIKATVTVAGGVAGGTVNMAIGDLSICNNAPVQSGTATCSLKIPQPGTYSVNAIYSGDTNTTQATATALVTVGKPGISISTAYTPAAPAFGSPLTLTSTVTGVDGQAAPTGTVAFTDGTTGLGVASLGADGKASVGVLLSVGTHSIVAIYSGDSNYQSATAPAAAIVVGKGSTTLALTATTAQVGQTTTLKATVVVAGASSVAAGTVSMSSGDTAICTAIPLQSSSATCTLKILQFGTYTITASYSGDANTAASSGSVQFVISKQAAGVSVAYTPAAPVYGGAVTISALVAAGDGQPAPSGSVAFADGSAALGTAAVGSDGRAAVVPTLNVGTHSIVASYSGDSNYQAISSLPVNVTVAKAATNTVLASSPAQVGQPVTLRATVTIVSPGSGTAGGSVDFSSAGKGIAGCSGVALQSGIAVCTTTFPQLGDYAVAATYNGDANTGASTSALSISAGKVVAGFYTAATSTTAPFGAPVTVNALLMAAAGVAAPTGTVTFSDGATALTTAPVGADGRASLLLGSATPLTVGTHSIVAVYNGDGNYQTATAPPLNIVVAKAATNVLLTSNAAQVGQPLNLKAAVTVVAPGSAAVAGTVDFTNGGTGISGCVGLVPQNGTAVCNTMLTQLGDFTIAAAYNGDANTAAGAATLKLTVGKAVPGVYAASAPSAPVYGVAVSINALVLGATGLPAPTGNVTFFEGTVALGTVALGSDGRASLVAPSNSIAALGAGTHSVVAVYTGDANYGATTATALNVTIAKAATGTVLTSTNGQVTATVSALAPGAGSPTGAVQFLQGGASLGSVVLVQQGSSFVAVLAGSPGGSLTAVYQGDANFASSTSAPLAAAAPVQVSLSSDRNPATPGQTVTFTVRVSPNSGTGTPGGSVQLSVDGAVFGTAALANGQVLFPITTLAVGTHTVTASYTGDTAFAAGTATMQQVVSKAAMALGLTSSAASAVFGQPVIFTAQLASSGTQGTVQFSDGTASIGSASAAAGVAVLTVGSLAVGSHSISASWPGDANSAAATSSALPVTVAKAQTAASISLSGNLWKAVVAAVAPGAGVPTGTVKFVNASTSAVLASVPLDGNATATSASSSSESIVAVYSGDGNFLPATSSPLTPLTAMNAASYAIASFAPDELATLFGSNLATSTASPTSGPVTSLGGTTVSVLDSTGVKRAAELSFVSPEQVSFLVPSDTALGLATVVVANAKTGEMSTAIQVVSVAPGLFTMNSTGQGAAAGQVVRVHLDGTQDTPQDVAVFDKSRNQWAPAPIDLGGPTDAAYLLLYGTGIRHAGGLPLCTIGGRPSTVVYAGAQGSFAGLDQVNVLLPRSLRGAGAVEVKLTVDGVVANAVTLAFQ